MNCKQKKKENQNIKNMANINDQKSTADREIVITRILNAPKELVFDVWTDPNTLTNGMDPTASKPPRRK